MKVIRVQNCKNRVKAVGIIIMSGSDSGSDSRRADTTGHEDLHTLGTVFIVFLALDKEDSQTVLVVVVSSLLDVLTGGRVKTHIIQNVIICHNGFVGQHDVGVHVIVVNRALESEMRTVGRTALSRVWRGTPNIGTIGLEYGTVCVALFH